MSDNSTRSHQQVWELIPWLVNGTATPQQHAQVQAHLRGCADCRDEFALQLQFHAGLTAPQTPAHDPHPGLRHLLARIDADTAADAATLAAPARPTPRPQRWLAVLAAAVVVQAVGLAMLGGVLLGRPTVASSSHPSGGYQTLSRSTSSDLPAQIRLVASPQMTLATLQQVLRAEQLKIVESSDDSAIFGLAPTQQAGLLSASERAAHLPQLLQRLRAQPGVLLAEPVAGSTAALAQ